MARATKKNNAEENGSTRLPRADIITRNLQTKEITPKQPSDITRRRELESGLFKSCDEVQSTIGNERDGGLQCRHLAKKMNGDVKCTPEGVRHPADSTDNRQLQFHWSERQASDNGSCEHH